MYLFDKQEMLISTVSNKTKMAAILFLLSCDWNAAFCLAELPYSPKSGGHFLVVL